MAAKDIEAGRAHVLIRLRDQVSAGLKQVERKFSGFGRSFATAGAAMTAGAAGILAFPLQLSANMEQLQISFEVMLGSAEAAQKMLDDLATFAKETPFSLEDLSSNAQLLLNFGVASNQVMGDLKALGDVSTGNADKFSRLALAYGQAQAKGRLMGGEVMQMVEAGFNPLQEMARTTGKSVATLQKEMENGQISARQLTAAFQSAAGPGGKFYRMMEKQSQSGLGLLSTLMDAIAFGFKPLGDATLAALKPMATWAIRVSDAFSTFMQNNKALAKAIAITLLVITGIGVALTSVGVVAMAISTIVGGLSLAWGALVATLATVFSPVGAVVAALVGLAATAWQFREQIAAAFAAVADFFRPLTDAIGRVWSVFSETFGGIVSNLLSGKLSDAAGVAWLGFAAAAWQGVAELGRAIEAGLGFLGAWIPGVNQVRDYVTQSFASIGQAILAGRWDLAAAIAMTKIRLAIESRLNVIRGAWTAFTIVLGNIWDSIVNGIRATWRNAVTEIAKSFVWVAQQFGFAMDGVREQLDRMRAADQRADNNARKSRENARLNAGAASLAANAAREAELRDQLADLERQSAEAYAAAGAPTIQDVADNARRELQDAIAQANEQANKSLSEPEQKLKAQSSAAGKELGKLTSVGTFSGAAAAQALNFDSRPQQETARNTKKIVQLMQQQPPPAVFG